MIEFLAGAAAGALVVILWALRAAKKERKDEHDRTGSDKKNEDKKKERKMWRVSTFD